MQNKHGTGFELAAAHFGGPMAHTFGGSWTDLKLDAFSRYMTAYATALQHKPTKKRPFIRLYVDAFAGTGTRTKRKVADPVPEGSLFGPCDDDEIEAEVKKGSVVIALETAPRFARYIFIEKHSNRAAELRSLVANCLDRDIKIVSADANDALGSVLNSLAARGVD